MSQGLEDIKSTLIKISRGDSIIDLLLEFERTLDATEVFSYRNWYYGELIDGPHIERYWFNTSWMFPYKLMPDPDAALRLEKIGCKVHYAKDTLLQPVRVLTPRDWKNKQSKDAKIEELPVWVVSINMPIKYVSDRLDLYQDYIDDIIDQDQDVIQNEIPKENEQEVFNNEEDEVDELNI